MPSQERTASGLHLPQAQVGDVRMWWRVEQVGEGGALPKKLKTKPHGLVASDYAPGDIVCTALHTSHYTFEDGTERKIVDCEQIIGKLEEA
jgi:hypothetical protein